MVINLLTPEQIELIRATIDGPLETIVCKLGEELNELSRDIHKFASRDYKFYNPAHRQNFVIEMSDNLICSVMVAEMLDMNTEIYDYINHVISEWI